MKYHPRRPPEGINSSPDSPIKDALILVVLSLAGLVLLFFLLQLLVGWGAQKVSLKNEVDYLQQLPLSLGEENSELQQIVDKLWAHDPASSEVTIRAAELTTAELNAFMQIGGNLGVTSGLLKKMDYENELAFVVCHELGHFKNRDALQGMGISLSLSILLFLIGIDGDLDFINLGAKSLTLAYSRKQEKEADEFALQCMNNTYNHVQGYDRFFKLVLEKDSNLTATSRKILSFASSHPLTENRLSFLKNLIKKNNYNDSGEMLPLKLGSLDHKNQ